MQVLPFLQVSDIRPSASFYAAITHPLGLRYISSTPSSIVFGDAASPSPEPIFEVKKSIGTDNQPPQPCHLVLSASSPSIVSAFHAAGLRAYPDLKDCDENYNYLQPEGSDVTNESRARIGDLDGNIMEVVHGSRPGYAASQAGSAVQRSSPEASRVLDWNLDVGSTPTAPRSLAGSVAPTSAGSRAVSGAPRSFLQRSATASTVETSPREVAKGPDATTVVGTVLGMAVGAAVGGALTYSMLKNDSTGYREAAGFQQGYEQQPSDQPRYVDYLGAGARYPPSSFFGGAGRSRVVEELDDRASRYSGSTHYTTTGGSRARGRSEVSAARRPLMIADHEHRSNASGASSSKHGASPPPRRSLADGGRRSSVGSKYTAADSRAGSRRSPESDLRSFASSRQQHTAAAVPRARDRADVESFVSGRSDRTARPAPARVETAPPSRVGSRYSAASTARPPAAARTHSHLSVAASTVAPSDSISNIGAKRSHRV
ncbi:hypothetical protein GGR52DRAFT_586857 [Hypoxylon sp. FL1284]|nr:hypothetical protein GGR52DRAFT_586857 [Hypoxylon sp. FL1284]